MRNYDFEEKNKWRRMVWQRVVARLRRFKVKPEDAIVVYLPGPEDLDRPIAIRKGLRWNNMIAVDKDKKIIDKLREDGKLAFQGSLTDVLRAWSYKSQPNVIIADFCSNLHPTLVRQLMEILLLGTNDRAFLASNAVMVVNFQRGRERSNRVADFFKCESKFADQFARDFGTEQKHRGVQFLAYMVAAVEKISAEAGEPIVRGVIQGLGGVDYAVSVIKTFRPECFTYTGIGGLKMDSVILTRALKEPDLTIAMPGDYELSASERAAKRRIAACMALRTTRLQSM